MTWTPRGTKSQALELYAISHERLRAEDRTGLAGLGATRMEIAGLDVQPVDTAGVLGNQVVAALG